MSYLSLIKSHYLHTISPVSSENVHNESIVPEHKICRSSLPEVFLRKGVLKSCSKFTGEHQCRNVISIKLLCNFIEITLRYGCFPLNLLHIFGTPFYKNAYEVLLLNIRFSICIKCVTTLELGIQSCNFLISHP